MAIRQNGDRLALAEKILLETVTLAKQNELDFRKWKEEHEAWRKEQEKQQAEFARQYQILLKKQAERDKQMGELSNKLGTVVEDFVIPNMSELLHELVPSVDESEIVVNARVKRMHRPTKEQVEIDAMAEGGNVVLVNETKTTMKIDYIDNFLSLLATFKRFFGEYQDFKILGMVSSLYVDPSVAKYAGRQGLLVVALRPGLMEVVNEAGFVPKEF